MDIRSVRVAFLSIPLIGVSVASAAALDGSVDLSVQSAYIWRGMVLNDKPVFQPSLSLYEGPWSASIWSNINLTADHGYDGVASEMDYWLAYTFGGKDVDLTLTYYAYTFPHTTSVSTQEVWANLTFKSLPMAPSLTAIRDVNAIKGWYFLLTGSQNLGLLKMRGSDGLVLTVNVGHGTTEYCRGYFPEIEHDSVTDFGARLDWPLKVGPGKLKLDVQYTNFTDADVYAPGFEGKRANLVGGVVYSLAF
jgi:hypothetical protein